MGVYVMGVVALLLGMALGFVASRLEWSSDTTEVYSPLFSYLLVDEQVWGREARTKMVTSILDRQCACMNRKSPRSPAGETRP